MTGAIYAHYSSYNQREESIEGQIRKCTAFAEKNDITILKHYIERAFSAKTDRRPTFQEMIKDSGKKLFDIVLVWKLDRFARNRYDSARYKSALKKNGAKVVSAMDDDVIDAIVSMVMCLQEQENVNLPLYEKGLSETEKSIESLLNAI